MVEVRQYIDRMGRRPFRRWLENLDPTTRSRILTSLTRVEQGNLSAAKAIGGGLSELRLDFGPGYRVYLPAMATRWSSSSAVAPSEGNKPTSMPPMHSGRNIKPASGRNDATD